MHTLTTFGQTFTAPENWDEITRDQVLFLIRAMNEGQSYNTLMFRLVVEFFQLPTKKMSFLKHSRPRRYEEYCADLLTATDGLFDFLFEKTTTPPNSSPSEGLGEIIIAKKLTRQLLPEYNGFYGPKAGLSNVQIWEFTMAEAAFMELASSDSTQRHGGHGVAQRDMEALDRLIATIYRPARADVERWRESDEYNLDDRRVFNDQLIERDMLLVKEWPQEIKDLIFIFFFSCREALQGMFPKIYRNRLKKKGGKAASWTDVILQQATEEKKEADEIAERNMMTFLRQRELVIEDAEYQQDEFEKITNKNKRT